MVATACGSSVDVGQADIESGSDSTFKGIKHALLLTGSSAAHNTDGTGVTPALADIVLSTQALTCAQMQAYAADNNTVFARDSNMVYISNFNVPLARNTPYTLQSFQAAADPNAASAAVLYQNCTAAGPAYFSTDGTTSVTVSGEATYTALPSGTKPVEGHAEMIFAPGGTLKVRFSAPPCALDVKDVAARVTFCPAPSF
jgi:hypothetical protein